MHPGIADMEDSTFDEWKTTAMNEWTRLEDIWDYGLDTMCIPPVSKLHLVYSMLPFLSGQWLFKDQTIK